MWPRSKNYCKLIHLTVVCKHINLRTIIVFHIKWIPNFQFPCIFNWFLYKCIINIFMDIRSWPGSANLAHVEHYSETSFFCSVIHWITKKISLKTLHVITLIIRPSHKSPYFWKYVRSSSQRLIVIFTYYAQSAP